MQCYNHELNAVAQCKHCLKCLCKDCVVLVNGVSSCKGHCETKNREYENYVELAKQSIGKVSSTQKRAAIFCLVLGGLFVVIGLIPLVLKGSFDSIILSVIGLPFLLGAYFNLKSAREIRSDENA